jgi:hypothetical protein
MMPRVLEELQAIAMIVLGQRAAGISMLSN